MASLRAMNVYAKADHHDGDCFQAFLRVAFILLLPDIMIISL